ncbi:Organ-specific protein S2 [Spatholobus suberectus]|nr:Organ-specific protein S2 [Spatholobus suberectus]
MRPALALLPLLFAFLFVATIESRKDPGEYWKMIMKDQEMPEGIQGLLSFQSENNPKTQEQLVEGSEHNCEEPVVTNTQVTIEQKVFAKDFDTKVGHKNDESQVNSDFKPRPSVTKYDDFEPRPSVTKYDDFEPRPSVTNYDFEPRPSATKYND